MKLFTLILLLLTAPALAQDSSMIGSLRVEPGPIPQYEFPKLDATDLDSLWALGTVRDNGEVIWRYVTGDHCNASRSHYIVGEWQDSQIRTAEFRPGETATIQTADLRYFPTQPSTANQIEPYRYRFSADGAQWTLYGGDHSIAWGSGLDASVYRVDTLPPPAITITPDVGSTNRVIRSAYSGEAYRAGTGTFTDPTGTLGDTTYLIDYKNQYPSIYQLSRIDPKSAQPPPKYLFVFKKQKAAQVWSEIAGYGFIALGAYLGGKAEYYSRYHGTTDDWDTYHVTRDAGLVSTGFGCLLVGGSFALDDKLELWEIGVKGFGMLLGYRSIAEATYNGMKK